MNRLSRKILFLRFVMALAISVILFQLFDAATYDWSLAVYACTFAILYVYVYKLLEDKYMHKTRSSKIDKNRLERFIYLSKWIFFVIFLFFETIVLADWGLLTPQSGKAILVPLILAFIVANYLELGDPPKVFSFQTKEPADQKLCNLIDFLLFNFIFLILALVIFSVMILAVDRYHYRVLQEIASGIVIASAFTSLANLYFVRFKNYLIEK